MLKVKNYKKNVHVLVQLEKRDLKQKSKVKKKKKKRLFHFLNCQDIWWVSESVVRLAGYSTLAGRQAGGR